MTGLGNTLINYMVIRFAMNRLGVSDYDFVVEGDDLLIGSNDPKLPAKLVNIYK